MAKNAKFSFQTKFYFDFFEVGNTVQMLLGPSTQRPSFFQINILQNNIYNGNGTNSA